MANWAQPQKVDDLTLAFPGNVVAVLMPDYDDIPDDFKKSYGNKWVEFQKRWFFDGLPPTMTVDLNDGIDGSTAFRHLKAIQGSFEPKHEHKAAAVAYLASLWFHDVDYGDG